MRKRCQAFQAERKAKPVIPDDRPLLDNGESYRHQAVFIESTALARQGTPFVRGKAGGGP